MDNFGNLLNQFAATANTVYGTLNQPKNTAAATPTVVTVQAATPAWQKYIPYGIGVVLLLVVLSILKRK